jgi:plastocyanin
LRGKKLIFLCVVCPSSGGHRITPLTVIVDPRKDVEVEVSDAGFKPKIIRLDEGNAINWSWNECERPHSITEAVFSHYTGKLHQIKPNNRYDI